jgi:hypothetical protein
MSHAKAQRRKGKPLETRQRFATLRLCVRHDSKKMTFRARPLWVEVSGVPNGNRTRLALVKRLICSNSRQSGSQVPSPGIPIPSFINPVFNNQSLKCCMATTVNFYFHARLINIFAQVVSDAIALCFRNIELFDPVSDQAVYELTL